MLILFQCVCTGISIFIFPFSFYAFCMFLILYFDSVASKLRKQV